MVPEELAERSKRRWDAHSLHLCHRQSPRGLQVQRRRTSELHQRATLPPREVSSLFENLFMMRVISREVSGVWVSVVGCNKRPRQTFPSTGTCASPTSRFRSTSPTGESYSYSMYLPCMLLLLLSCVCFCCLGCPREDMLSDRLFVRLLALLIPFVPSGIDLYISPYEYEYEY